MLVREIMTSPPACIEPDATLAEATRLLDHLGVTSLPVVDPGRRLLGMLGEADVIAHLSTPEEHRCGSRRDEPPQVRDAMTHRVLTAGADDDLADIIALMTGTALKSLPVLLHGRVMGMVSRRDVIRALARGELGPGPTREAVRA